MSIIQERTIENSLVPVNPVEHLDLTMIDLYPNINWDYGKLAGTKDFRREFAERVYGEIREAKTDGERIIAKMRLNSEWGSMYPNSVREVSAFDPELIERITQSAQRILGELQDKIEDATEEALSKEFSE
ncbi:hypothetical protein PP939_gp168 [Rhizobium phage RL38J1]|uniref:Uncharacterized protein n=1 Tax=Rhizobium phage RL38J1 TaxID=2663232 RepID=A0A6B9J5F0_9CAUD|nr:hypothetical protein PP939_gp168 [Rhizobium phage RL38J1]QGZ13955.1 hypothetical protein RL38J1_168 [Rhizobium phage RL38J1]